MDAGKQTFALQRVKMTSCKFQSFGVHAKIFQQWWFYLNSHGRKTPAFWLQLMNIHSWDKETLPISHIYSLEQSSWNLDIHEPNHFGMYIYQSWHYINNKLIKKLMYFLNLQLSGFFLNLNFMSVFRALTFFFSLFVLFHLVNAVCLFV